ncbi:MAG: hypothetical protein DWQ36_21205 [Acidobacteria bacterium]|nr:MAG: hypothetical protein DWQ30_09845 [Acidobacteriota bacterium]REK01029.1 MAG: hypothetical protein DWQ36_21205 [Acidobacteriota bacterium]
MGLRAQWLALLWSSVGVWSTATSAVSAQQARLEWNLNDRVVQQSSEVVDYHRVGDFVVFFQRKDQFDGDVDSLTLWSTAGTTSTTKRIAGFDVDFAEVCGDRAGLLLFRAGGGLYRTDGTLPGTFRLLQDATCSSVRRVDGGWVFVVPGGVWSAPDLDSHPVRSVSLSGVGPSSASAHWLGRNVFTTVVNGRGDLWATDGTERGTERIAMNAGRPFVAGDRVVFVRASSDVTADLWSTTGDETAEIRLTEQSSLTGIAVVGAANDLVFFRAFGIDGEELWRTDGTPGGTIRLTDFDSARPFPLQDSSGQLFVAFEDRLIFASEDAASSGEVTLFSTDGVGSPAHLGSTSRGRFESRRLPASLALFVGERVLLTDGTGGGTRVLEPGARVGGIVSSGGEVLFWLEHVDGFRLMSLSENAQLGELFTITSPRREGLFSFARLGSRVLLSRELDGYGFEPSVIELGDSPPRLTTLIDLEGAEYGSLPHNLVAFEDRLLFRAYSGPAGLRQFRLAGDGSPPRELFGPVFGCGNVYGSDVRLFVVCRDEVHVIGPGLAHLATVDLSITLSGFRPQLLATDEGLFWRSDELIVVTNEGELRSFDLPAGSSGINELIPVGSEMLARSASAGMPVLYHLDVAQGVASEIVAGVAGLSRTQFGIRELAGFIWFGFDEKIWRLDPETLEAVDMTAADPRLFGATLVVSVGEVILLWRPDGLSGELLLWDPEAGQIDSLGPSPGLPPGDRFSHAAADAAYFTLATAQGHTVWYLEQGGVPLPVVGLPAPEDWGATPGTVLSALGTELLTLPSGEYGREIWRLDRGRASLVKDFYPGPITGVGGEIVSALGKVYFAADDGLFGEELWSLSDGASPCHEDDSRAACLAGDRFALEVVYRLRPDEGWRRAVASALTEETATFWFFEEENVEVLAKVVDGTAFNGFHWLFVGALTSLDYVLTVADLESGRSRRLHNLGGQVTSMGDVEALSDAVTVPGLELSSAGTVLSEPLPCDTEGDRFCLGTDDRFEVAVTWTDFAGGSGTGKGRPLSEDTVAVWFFDPDKLELALKVVDGASINDRFWFFSGSLSNTEYTITVRDTITGVMRTYTNELGVFGSVADIDAFPVSLD